MNRLSLREAGRKGARERGVVPGEGGGLMGGKRTTAEELAVYVQGEAVPGAKRKGVA